MTISKKYKEIPGLRFGTKIFLSYLILILLPLLVWSGISYRQANAAILDQVNASVDESFNTLVYQLNGKMDNLSDRLLLATNNVSVSGAVCRQYQSRYIEYHDTINIIDPMLNTLQVIPPEIDEIEIYTQGSIKGARVMFKDFEELSSLGGSQAIMESVTPVWLVKDNTVLLGKRIVSHEDPFVLAAILLSIDDSLIFDEGSMPDIQQYGVIVSDAGGNILFRHDAASLSAEGTGYTPEEIFAEAETPADSGLIVRKGTLASGAWNIYMYADSDSFKLSPLDNFRTTLLFLLIISGMMFVTAILFARSFSKRVSVLNTYTRGIVKNNFQDVITSGRKDEIGEITNSVGQMVLETRRMINEVYESRLAKKAAEIKALQAQINPHFLYNTLSSVNWMAIRSGNETISGIITNLSIFYRATLNKGDSVTTIEKELETTRAYIDIQLLVHKHSFDVSFDIEPSVLEYQIPSIILQPIVENAIEHGICVLPEDVRGELTISVYERDCDILFDIFDNGPGLSDEEIREILESKKGYGVKNVNDRLKLFFDDTYGISFTSAPERGLTVTISVPKYIDLNDES